jgi:hypothetical protein
MPYEGVELGPMVDYRAAENMPTTACQTPTMLPKPVASPDIGCR